MDQINNNDSEIYKNAIKRTEHIYIKLEKSKMNCLVSDLKLVGTEKDILAHLKGGPSKNLINSFFNYTTDLPISHIAAMDDGCQNKTRSE